MKKLGKINKHCKNAEGYVRIKYGRKKLWCPITWYKNEKKIDVMHPEIGAIILMLQYTKHCPFKIWKIDKNYKYFSSLIPIDNVSVSFNHLTEEHIYKYKNGVMKDCGCYCPNNLKYNSIKLF